MDNQGFNSDKIRTVLGRNVTEKISSVGKELIEFRSNFQQSAQTIIDNLSHLLNSVEDNVLEGLSSELSQFEADIRSRLEPQLKISLENQIREQFESEIENRLVAAREEGIHAIQEKTSSKLEILNGALREISQQKSQVDILGSYLDKAALFAPRVVLFVVKSSNAVGWQARGFSGSIDNESVKSLAFSLDGINLFRGVVDSKAPVRAKVSDNPDIREFISRLGSASPETICAIPLVVRNKTVALLYGDSGTMPEYPVDIHSLEMITTTVGLTVELNSARTKLGLAAPQTAPPEKPAAHPEAASASEEPARYAAPPPEVPEQFSSPEAAPPEAPASEPPPPPPAQVDVQPGGYPRELPQEESLPEPTPPPLPQQAVSPSRSQATQASQTSAPVADLEEAEQKVHNDARRFARLLVSEIKLYNEQKVLQGRQDKNLYDLLRDDIDKSREMYDNRIDPSVAAKVDYFYDELVRILADNQVEALGRDCPGPVLVNN